MSNWNIPTYLLIVVQISVVYCLRLKQRCCIDVAMTNSRKTCGSRETIIILAEIEDTFKESKCLISIQRSSSVIHEQTNARMTIYRHGKTGSGD